MARAVLLTLAILVCGQAIYVHPADITRSLKRLLRKPRQNTYWQIRDQLMTDEKQQSLGGKLELNPIEARANQVLMRAKSREIYDGLILSLTIANSRVDAIDSRLTCPLLRGYSSLTGVFFAFLGNFLQRTDISY